MNEKFIRNDFSTVGGVPTMDFPNVMFVAERGHLNHNRRKHKLHANIALLLDSESNNSIIGECQSSDELTSKSEWVAT